MLPYSQAYSDAIRSTDRTMRGYIRVYNHGGTSFHWDTVQSLISFKVTANAMDAERFCIGSTTSSYCEYSFFSGGSRDEYNISDYFDVYVAVQQASYTPISTVLTTEFITPLVQIEPPYSANFNNNTQNPLLNNIPNGQLVELTVNNVKGYGYWDNDRGMSISVDGYSYAINELLNNGVSYIPHRWKFVTDYVNISEPSYEVTIKTVDDEAKCLGRFKTSEISHSGNTTTVIGYDEVSMLVNKYVPTITADSNGYEVIDILNDIVDQTGVNGGEHFTTTGSGIYVENIPEATCREQWGWLMTLCNNYGANSIGSRTSLGYIEQRAYENGKNNYTNYPVVDSTVIYQDGLSVGNLFTISSLTTGTDQHPIVVGSGTGVNGNNPYIDTTHATTIFNNLNGVNYTPMTLHWRGDPCIELMDSLHVQEGSGANAKDYRCIAMKITSTYNGGFEQTIECWGDGEDYYDMSIGSIGATVNSIADYVIEEGKTSSPAWYYRKWKSGYYECMHRGIFTRSSWSASGSLYVASSGAGTQTYPVTFLAQPIEIVTAHADTPILLMCTDKQTTTVSGKYQFAVTSAPSGSQQIYVDYYVRGNV